jgi:hypothetical protein
MPRQAEIRRRLQAEVDRTRKVYQQATEGFNVTLNTIPTGLPQPDGVTHIEHSGRSFGTALQEYMAAVKALSDFVLKGTEPERPVMGERSYTKDR